MMVEAWADDMGKASGIVNIIKKMREAEEIPVSFMVSEET